MSLPHLSQNPIKVCWTTKCKPNVDQLLSQVSLKLKYSRVYPVPNRLKHLVFLLREQNTFYVAQVIFVIFSINPLFSFFCCTLLRPHSEADEGCKKHMERLLNIWKERSLYRADFIQQLKLAIEDSNSPRPAG